MIERCVDAVVLRVFYATFALSVILLQRSKATAEGQECSDRWM